MVNAILGLGNDLPQRLAQIERSIRDLSTQPMLLNASTGQTGGKGLATDANGLHLFNPSGVENVTLSTVDGSATFAGNATFGGSVVINGNLSVPNGSISNAALQNPIQTGSSGSSGSNFATTTAGAAAATGAITVPAGFTQATIMVIAGAGAVNSTASGDFIYVSASINGLAGGERATPASAGGYGSSTASAIRTLTGLSGGTITVGAVVRTGSIWAASGSNVANCDAIATFTR